MWFRWGTTCFTCRIVINSVSFLKSVIFIRIRDVINKSQVFRGLWCRIYSSMCGAGLIADGKSGYFTVCLDLEVMPLMLVKSNNRMRGLLVPSKPWERRTAFGANHLPILWEDVYTLHNKYEGPNFYLGHPLYRKIKLIIFFNERGKISPLNMKESSSHT